MQITFDKHFQKDIMRLPVEVQKQVKLIVNNIQNASYLSEVPNTKKLSGFKNHYRIRVGNYRLGIYLEAEAIVISRILHRKDIYKKFP